MDADEIKLARQRLRIETQLRRADQKLQREQFVASQTAQGGWKVIFTPTGAAVAAAVIGICGTAASKWFDLHTEEQQQETSIILKASDVPQSLDEASRSVQRARNVLWFAEAGYISLPDRFLAQLRADAQLKSGQTLSAPAVQSTVSAPAVSTAKKTLFESGMRIDADGAYHAYHPDGKSGLDFLSNAGSPGHWYGLITDSGEPSGNPIIQRPNDPAPGYYVSFTSLQDQTKDRTDPRRYLNAEEIPYVVLAPGGTTYSLGDICVCYSRSTNMLVFAIFGDIGPLHMISPEGSIKLAKELAVPSDVKTGGAEKGIVYLIFPNSGNGKPKPPDEIKTLGTQLLEKWGGIKKLKTSATE